MLHTTEQNKPSEKQDKILSIRIEKCKSILNMELKFDQIVEAVSMLLRMTQKTAAIKK